MSLQVINLRKLLKLMYLDQRGLTAALRTDILEDRNRERGSSGGGGDFYGPFWSDAKDHVFDRSDLHVTTAQRIEANDRRRNLYPLLRDGFLLWWNRRRRWTNAPFLPIDVPTTRFRIASADTTIKINCILAVRDGRGDDHHVYPYWFEQPALSDEAARVGMWALSRALTSIPSDELRLLDVVRGQTFSLERNPLRGDEEHLFVQNFLRISQRREVLRAEYDH